MRKTFLFMMLSANGYFEGVEHDISWHNTDIEFSNFADNQLDETDTLVFGHRTYELMANFWPTAAAQESEPGTAKRMNSLSKVVFSRDVVATNWENTKSYKGNVAKIITSLKQKTGKDIAVLASSNLCLTLIKEGLLDELRLMINPIILGKGTSLFEGLESSLNLKLKNSKTFRNGNILLIYDVIK